MASALNITSEIGDTKGMSCCIYHRVTKKLSMDVVRQSSEMTEWKGKICGPNANVFGIIPHMN